MWYVTDRDGKKLPRTEAGSKSEAIKKLEQRQREITGEFKPWPFYEKRHGFKLRRQK